MRNAPKQRRAALNGSAGRPWGVRSVSRGCPDSRLQQFMDERLVRLALTRGQAPQLREEYRIDPDPDELFGAAGRRPADTPGTRQFLVGRLGDIGEINPTLLLYRGRKSVRLPQSAGVEASQMRIRSAIARPIGTSCGMNTTPADLWPALTNASCSAVMV